MALVASFWAERLLFFAALPVALGVGLLPGLAAGPAPRTEQAQRRVRLAALAVAAAVLAGSLHDLATRPLTFIFRGPQDRLAVAIRRHAPPDALLWNWWDDGYFLAARSGHAALFDGGSQTPLMSFIAAHPLAGDDPLMARRWIRFFAKRGEDGIVPLRNTWGSDEEIWKRLDAVFSAKDPLAALQEQPKMKDVGPEWLFPAGKVYLYLPQRFLRLSRWWMSMGRSLPADPADLRPHIDAFPRAGFRYDPEQRQPFLPPEVMAKGYKDFGGVFDTSRAPLAPPWGGGAPGPYVVASDHSP
jgi:hypothetical protein